jgi:hypothetical protein
MKNVNYSIWVEQLPGDLVHRQRKVVRSPCPGFVCAQGRRKEAPPVAICPLLCGLRRRSTCGSERAKTHAHVHRIINKVHTPVLLTILPGSAAGENSEKQTDVMEIGVPLQM